MLKIALYGCPPHLKEIETMQRNQSMTIVLTRLLIILVALSPMAMGKLQPETLPDKGIWQVDAHLNGHPKRLNIKLPGEDKVSHYWYQLITVTNNTGRDLEFYPQAQLYTNTFKTTIAGKNVRNVVFEAIKEKYTGTIPLLQAQSKVTTRFLQGDDNAKDLVLIFTDTDPKATSAQIFVSGLSNESKLLTLPGKVESGQNSSNKPKEVLLLKNLQLKYKITGKQEDFINRAMLYSKRNWIMR